METLDFGLLIFLGTLPPARPRDTCRRGVDETGKGMASSESGPEGNVGTTEAGARHNRRPKRRTVRTQASMCQPSYPCSDTPATRDRHKARSQFRVCPSRPRVRCTCPQATLDFATTFDMREGLRKRWQINLTDNKFYLHGSNSVLWRFTPLLETGRHERKTRGNPATPRRPWPRHHERRNRS